MDTIGCVFKNQLQINWNLRNLWCFQKSPICCRSSSSLMWLQLGEILVEDRCSFCHVQISSRTSVSLILIKFLIWRSTVCLWVCVSISEAWCQNAAAAVNKHCSSLLELVIIKSPLFYLLRKFCFLLFSLSFVSCSYFGLLLVPVQVGCHTLTGGGSLGGGLLLSGSYFHAPKVLCILSCVSLALQCVWALPPSTCWWGPLFPSLTHCRLPWHPHSCTGDHLRVETPFWMNIKYIFVRSVFMCIIQLITGDKSWF